MRPILLLVAVFSTTLLKAQPVADFSVPPSVCIRQVIKPVNNSTGSTVEWDFCQGDLSFSPIAEASALAAGTANIGIDIVKDGSSWFGFVTDATNNTIIRLSYGSDINSTPSISSLGSIFSSTVTPYDIKIVYDNHSWYGFVYGVTNTITRLDFGASLTNTPTTETVVAGNGSTSGLDVVFANNKWHLVYTRFFVMTVVRLNNITTIPVSGDIIEFSLTDVALRLGDVKVFEDNGNWFAYSPTYDNTHTLQRFSFGATLFSMPTASNVTGSMISTVTPYGIDGGVDNGKYFLFVSTLNGNLVRIDLGDDLSVTPTSETALGSFGLLSNTLKIVLTKSGTSWNAHTIKYTTGQIYRLTFAAPLCHASINTSTEEEPTFSYDAAGTYYVTMRSYEEGRFDEKSMPITVQSKSVPILAINVDGICVSNPSLFSFNSSQPLASVSWNLGEGTTTTQTSPSIIYGGTGSYVVTLDVTASNGCLGSVTRAISIYNPPVAGFDLPAPAVACSNQEYVFSNSSTFDAGSSPTWQWFVDGTPGAVTTDLLKSFGSTDSYSIKLAASIPGCSSESTEVLVITQEGPSVDFNVTGSCQQTPISFQNTTSGSIASLSWDFGDGNTSSGATTANTYTNNGVYNVVLSATNSIGCVNSASKQLLVYSKPVPAFSLDLPPFSCSGTPSQFHDTTPAISDSNIQTWNWTFGDTGTGTGKNPIHTYAQAGPYTANLSVTTDKGCTASADQQVSITASPVAAFNFDPACAGKSTHFSDVSTGNITGWQWKAGTTVYASQNPTHVFAAPGNFSMQLTVTGQNNCTNTLSKPVVVPVIPVVDFDVHNQCSGQLAVFTDLTVNASDPIAQQMWTFNSSGTGTGREAEFSFANSGTYPVQLQVQGQSGCFYSASKQVVIRQSPVASFTMSDQSGPPPLHVSFTNTSTGASSYQWNFNDGNQPSTEVSPQYTYNTRGDYVVDLTAISADGCKKTESKIVSVIVPVNELTLEEFSLVQPSGGDRYRGYVRIRNNGNYRIENFSVSYGVGGGVLLRETIIVSLGANEEGTFLLSNEFVNPGTAAFVCAEVDSDTNLWDNKQCSVFGDSSFMLGHYPNPAATDVNIETIQSVAGTTRVRLYSARGELAYDRTFDVPAGLSRVVLDVQGLSSGIYVLIVTGDGYSSSGRLLVHH